MTMKHVSNPSASVGQVIDEADGGGVLIQAQGRPVYAMLPLDDEVIDYLLERNPGFAAECAGIRDRMRIGEYHSHDDVKRMFHDSDGSNTD